MTEKENVRGVSSIPITNGVLVGMELFFFFLFFRIEFLKNFMQKCILVKKYEIGEL